MTDGLPVSAIVLAGGVSRRMGETNKLHLCIDGVPMLRHCVEAILAADLQEVIVVLGHQRFETQALIDDLDVRTVYNDAYRSGQMTSVHCGLAVLEKRSAGVMVCLGDQPALKTSDLNLLIEAFSCRSGGDVVVPEYKGVRGNPIIISSRCRADISAGKHNLGCRNFVKKNPSLVHTVEMSNTATTLDLDTRQDFADYMQTQQAHNVDDNQEQVI